MAAPNPDPKPKPNPNRDPKQERRAASRRESWRRLRGRVELVEDVADGTLRRMVRAGSVGVGCAKRRTLTLTSDPDPDH